MEILQTIGTPILTALDGMITGIIIARQKWNIRKLELQHKYRKDLIVRARAFLASAKWDANSYSHTVEYSEIRPFLSGRTIASIEGDHLYLTPGRGGDIIKSPILDDLAKLEQKWELI